MYRKVKNIILDLKRKSFLQNFFSLTIFQIFELGIPLISIPIIISKVGASNFGLINIALAFCVFFQTIINFGFNIISFRDVARYSDSLKKLNVIFLKTTYSKLLLFLINSLIFIILIFTLDKFREEWLIYVLTFLALFFQSMMPIWFFQGIEKSRILAIANFFGKLLYIILIIFLIKIPDHYILVPLFSMISYILICAILYYSIFKNFDFKIKKIKISEIFKYISKGKYICLSEIKLYFISYFNILILGLSSGETAVGYFVGAEKILRAIANLFAPILNTLFPILTKKLNVSITEAYSFINKIALYSFAFLVLLCTSLFLLADFIISNYYYNSDMSESIIVFKILSFIPLLTFFDVFYGKLVLINLNKDKVFYQIILFLSIINLPILYILTTNYGYIGTSFTILISQFLLSFLSFFYAIKFMRKRMN